MLILGTSNWGTKIDKTTAFKLLEHYLDSGFDKIDTATNYPISCIDEDWRLAERWLKEYNESLMKIIVKIGSVSNCKINDINLKKEHILREYCYYKRTFNLNLNTLMIHWDTREIDIDGTIDAFEEIKYDVNLGISGIQYPDIYTHFFNSNNLKCQIQLNYKTGEFNKYSEIKNKEFQVYKKSDRKNYATDLKKCLSDNQIDFVLISPSSVDQLKNSINIYKSLTK